MAFVEVYTTGAFGTNFYIAVKTGADITYAPVDADFSSTICDGTMVLDVANNKLWVRMAGGAWKQTVLLGT